jgi:hypothetical protein
MADVKGLLADPRFSKLSPADQKRALSMVDPAFAGLSDAQLTDFKQRVQPTGLGAMGDQPAPPPGFLDELYQQNIAPLVKLGRTVLQQGPLTAVKNVATGLWQQQADQGKQTWDALLGRGEFQGYSPLARTSEAVGHGLATALPVLGPMAAHAGDNFGAGNFGAGNADALSLAAQTLGPGAAARGWSAIPRTARAASALDDVAQVAAHVPIDITDVGDAALRTRDLASSGGSMPKVVSDFIKRATDPNRGPITFSEARDFYSNATRLSADEYGRLTPVMKRQVAEFTKSLGDALQDAAAQVGKGDAYSQAIREYGDAAKWQRRAGAAGEITRDFLLKKALPAGLGYGLYRSLFEK